MAAKQKKSYRVYYIGDDSLGHSMVVCAKDHTDAVAQVCEKTGTDIVVGIKRCMNPYVKICVFVLATLLLLSLLVVSCVRMA